MLKTKSLKNSRLGLRPRNCKDLFFCYMSLPVRLSWSLLVSPELINVLRGCVYARDSKETRIVAASCRFSVVSMREDRNFFQKERREAIAKIFVFLRNRELSCAVEASLAPPLPIISPSAAGQTSFCWNREGTVLPVTWLKRTWIGCTVGLWDAVQLGMPLDSLGC